MKKLELKLSRDFDRYKAYWTNNDLTQQEVNRFFRYSDLCDHLDSLLPKVKNWKSLKIIYHYSEGEVNASYLTYVFKKLHNSTVFLYSQNSDRGYGPKPIKNKFFKKLKFKDHYIDHGMVIISDFDKNLSFKDFQINIGISLQDQNNKLFSIYGQVQYDNWKAPPKL